MECFGQNSLSVTDAFSCFALTQSVKLSACFMFYILGLAMNCLFAKTIHLAEKMVLLPNNDCKLYKVEESDNNIEHLIMNIEVKAKLNLTELIAQL